MTPSAYQSCSVFLKTCVRRKTSLEVLSEPCRATRIDRAQYVGVDLDGRSNAPYVESGQGVDTTREMNRLSSFRILLVQNMTYLKIFRLLHEVARVVVWRIGGVK